MITPLSTKQSIAAAAGLYIACLAAAAFTELLSSLPGPGISIWLPAGFLLAAVIVTPPARWPIWVLAASASELTGNFLWYDHAVAPILLLAFGNALAAIAGGILVRQAQVGPYVLDKISHTGLFIVAAAVLMPLISASIGSIALSWSYGKTPMDTWSRLMLGDATGAMVAAPLALLLVGAASPVSRLSMKRGMEACALVLVFFVMAAISLGGLVPFAFLMMLPLLWAALGFRITGAIIAIVALTGSTAIFTLWGISPFAQSASNVEFSHNALQLFLLVAATTSLFIGSIAEEHYAGVQQLNAANLALEERVAERSASLSISLKRVSEAGALLKAIGDASVNPIYAKNLNFEIVYANGATIDAFGASSLEALQQSGENAFYEEPKQFDHVRRNDQTVLSTQKTLVVEEIFTDKQGRTRIYRTSKSPLYDGEGTLTGLAGVSVDISDIKKAQAREHMLVREVEHRSRNLLAVVQGIVHLIKATSVEEFRHSIGRRIRALAKTNGTIGASQWAGASLRAIMENELSPYHELDDGRVDLSGEDVLVDPATAQSLTLVVHELSTNAAKYGALSVREGRLKVAWSIEQRTGKADLLTILWEERGGPAVTMPQNAGFGSAVMAMYAQERPENIVEHFWDVQGLRVRLVQPIVQNQEQII